MSLSEREILFLRALCSYQHGHVSQDTLKAKLEDMGVEEQEYKQLKKKLLYSGVIGVVYGNVTLEDKSVLDRLPSEAA
ncbi:hypothetical protein E2P71_04670 [Candidatus Bathyarchaeota archaeon]|nr:hypothetical protein E2P71_04670 [Candidatus Bathyarchaeota archaeon]